MSDPGPAELSVAEMESLIFRDSPGSGRENEGRVYLEVRLSEGRASAVYRATTQCTSMSGHQDSFILSASGVSEEEARRKAAEGYIAQAVDRRKKTLQELGESVIKAVSIARRALEEFRKDRRFTKEVNRSTKRAEEAIARYEGWIKRHGENGDLRFREVAE